MKYFMELTNPIHGGEGWDLGEKLWSPEKSNWKIMQEPRAGDIIIHSVKPKGGRHHFFGISIVRTSYKSLKTAPPKPDKWIGYETYYQIDLQDLSYFAQEKSMQGFLDEYKLQLDKIKPQHSFYNEKGRLQPSQKYLATVSSKVFQLLMNYLDFNFYSYLSSNHKNSNIAPRVEDEEEITTFNGGNSLPTRVTTKVSRIIRNTTIIKELKTKYKNKCQICGKQIKLPNGSFYSEGHHLKKLGGTYKGPDIPSNIIIVCPNHHTEFDYGSIAIDPKTHLIVDIDKSSEYNGKPLAYERSNLDNSFLAFHLKNIYNQ